MRYRTRTQVPRTRGVTRSAGFAIVLVLALLVIVGGTFIGLGLLIRLDTVLVLRRAQHQQAQSNARVALDLALAHLQREAGPDQRFTARSDLGPGSTEQPYVTGVWALDAEGTTRLRTWLISGNEGTNPLAVTPERLTSPSAPASTNEVFLVDRGTVSQDAQRVKAPKIAFTAPPLAGSGAGGATTSIGAGAYWIGDEGVKINLTLRDRRHEIPYDNRSLPSAAPAPWPAGTDWREGSDASIRLPQRLAARFRSESVVAGADPDETRPDGSGMADRLGRVISYQQLAYASAVITPGTLRAQFHHGTVASNSVLVDHSDPAARLKRDLSVPHPEVPATLRCFLSERPTSVDVSEMGLHPVGVRRAITGERGMVVSPILSEAGIQFRFRATTEGRLALQTRLRAELWNPYLARLTTIAPVFAVEVEDLPVIRVMVGESVLALPLRGERSAWRVPVGTVWEPGAVADFAGRSEALVSGTFEDPTSETIVPGVAWDPGSPPPFVTVELPATALPRWCVRLEEGSTVRYEPQGTTEPERITFVPVRNPSWQFGYGFELDRRLERWTGFTAGDERDPRDGLHEGSFHETDSSRWPTRASDAAGRAEAASDVFRPGARLPLFELPQTEIVTVAEFRHASGRALSRLGTPAAVAMNELFDRYFLSTVPRWADWDPTAPAVWPNMSIHLWSAGGRPARKRPSHAGPEITLPEAVPDHRGSAEKLMLRGAFNVNSTLEIAWRTVLGGTSVSDWRYADNRGRPRSRALERAFFRFGQTAHAWAASKSRWETSAATISPVGAHLLTEEQVNQVAAEVVAAIKARGRPFRSLADFLDSGVVEAGLARIGINSHLPASMEGTPAWLTQADVLAPVLHLLVPRSDTFLIRAYGETHHPVSGKVEGRAWCEAVVQRYPDLVPVSPTPPSFAETLQPRWEAFPLGRRFRVVQFRWLGPADV